MDFLLEHVFLSHLHDGELSILMKSFKFSFLSHLHDGEPSSMAAGLSDLVSKPSTRW